MKKIVLALAVLAVTLPGLAFAGEPAPMSDTELDSVAAGYSAAQILASPGYAELVKRLQTDKALRDKVKTRLEAIPPEVLVKYSKDLEALRKAVPYNLRYLLPRVPKD